MRKLTSSGDIASIKSYLFAKINTGMPYKSSSSSNFYSSTPASYTLLTSAESIT